MKKRKAAIAAIIFSGAVGAASSPAWSQQAPGETRQPDHNLTRPGANENIPGVTQKGTPELSKSDMKAVEEALQKKGYKVGKVDGMADNDVRKAIRSFQQDNGLPITGMIDQRTADKLGVRISSRSGSSHESRSTGGTSGTGSKSGDDQSVPQGTRN
jgi:peptidoglycan hydrolase-like protein with peptidoglycan-binding domain